MAEPSPIRTVVVADFDNDGYEEIFYNNIPGENRLFQKIDGVDDERVGDRRAVVRRLVRSSDGCSRSCPCSAATCLRIGPYLSLYPTGRGTK